MSAGASEAEILPTHNRALFIAAVKRASAELRAGGVVGLPTETVYGLAANALDARAVQRIFVIKGRPSHNPVILHVSDLAMARRYVREWPEVAERLAMAFWPGPLTLVLPRAETVPDVVTAGGETVGVRWPSHPLIQAVIRECGFPLAAPSANPSNEVSPTNAEHVRKTLGGKLRVIVDGGQSQVGIESTVLDLCHRPVRILRPGLVHSESILAALGEGEEVEEAGVEKGGATLRSPGQLPKHYSPRAPVRILTWRDDCELRAEALRWVDEICRVQVIAHTVVPSDEGLGGVSVIPHDAEAFARALYGELHRCDEAGADLIVVEAVPDGVEWRAVADRLRRAAAE